MVFTDSNLNGLMSGDTKTIVHCIEPHFCGSNNENLNNGFNDWNPQELNLGQFDLKEDGCA